MNRRGLAVILLAVPLALSFPVVSQPVISFDAAHAAEGVSAKEAFEQAKELGTAEAWNAFLDNYSTGFHADLARAYLKKMGQPVAEPAPAAKKQEPVEKRESAKPAPVKKPETDTAKQPQTVKKPDTSKKRGPYEEPDEPAGSSIATEDKPAAPRKSAPGEKRAAATAAPAAKAGEPAVKRGEKFMGFAERFNRYYTDRDWQPSRIIYVSPNGKGNGATREAPAAVATAIADAAPGTQVYFLRGDYKGCFEMSGSGTYDEPIVLYGERNDNGTLGVKINCCTTGRHTCFNVEDADYIAVDGFELVGGKYGVRVVGRGYEATEHSRGAAVLNCHGHDQNRDPFFSGAADWAVWERNIAHGAKKEDGHGIYLSNGGDWNIVRFNETYNNASSDFQVNADPASTCAEVGIAYDDERCDAFGGGQGASDYFLIEGNYFHDSEVGPNFTSLRRSIVRNNIIGPQRRHNASFWQETDNPKLGASENKVLHNLFITTERHGVKFENSSTGNEFANNVIVGIQINDGEVAANPSALLMEVDESSADNAFRDNMYISGRLEGREPEADETAIAEFEPDWFAAFPGVLSHDPNGFAPTADAPFVGKGARHDDASLDRNGVARPGEPALGPFEPR